MMKRFFCVLLSLMLLAAATFALAEDTAEETAVEAPAEEVPAEAAAEEAAAEEPAEPVLLATVNSAEIWSDNIDLMYAFNYYYEMAVSYGLDPADQSVLPMLRMYSMEYAIQATVVRQKAEELGLGATEEDVEKTKEDIKSSWAEIVDSFVQEAGVITETSSEEDKAAARADAEATILANYGYDEESTSTRTSTWRSTA